MDKKVKILLLAIGIGLLVAIISTSFAYFTISNKTGNEEVITSGVMSLRLADGSQITKNFMIPGEYIEKTFSVTNTGNIATTYDIYLSDVVNTFVDKTDLVYELTSNDGGYSTSTQVQVPSTSTKIVDAQSIGTNTTHHYTLRIIFLNKNEAQDDNQGVSFSGKIQINEYESNGVPDDDTLPIVAEDSSGASAPELYDGLIPVVYDENGNTIVADTTEQWYDYDNDMWANAVLGTSSAKAKSSGDILSSDEILQYYVWIPRYRYQLFNAVVGETASKQTINIEFEDKDTSKSDGDENGEWLTHPAFTFGNTELNGFWVGKFETTGGPLSSGQETDLTVLPNINSLYLSLSSAFDNVRNMDLFYSRNYGLRSSQIDTHVMKNMEWGAVAYFYYSNKNSYHSMKPNDNSLYITGCGYNGSSSTNVKTCFDWNSSSAFSSTTTNNQYGIYDMYGGIFEMVMGNVSSVAPYTFNPLSSGFENIPLDQYMDKYINLEGSATAYADGKLGDATREILLSYSDAGGGAWGSSRAQFPTGIIASWFIRGGSYSRAKSVADIVSFMQTNGSSYGFRIVLSAQDGSYNGNGYE